MNSEFDALAAELGNAAPDVDRVKEILNGLKQNWPNKEKSMTDATRKLLADLGLLQAPAVPKVELKPAPAPAPAPVPVPTPAEKK